MDNAKKVSVELSLREARVVLRAINLAQKVSHNNGIGVDYRKQSEEWQALCDAEYEFKISIAQLAESLGFAFRSGYGVAQKWGSEGVNTSLPSCGKAVA